MAVNLIQAVTINRVMLYRGQPTTSSATMYTTTTDTKIASIVMCNTSAATATVTISVVNSGGTAGVTNQVLSGLSIPAYTTVMMDTNIYMTGGDFIAANQSTSGAITVSISGETYA
jgi:hypothetical protein